MLNVLCKMEIGLPVDTPCKDRNPLASLVIADTRIEDDLIALKIDGKKTLGNVSDSPIRSVRITRFSSLQPRYCLAVIQDF